jgi:hypothetical protein
VNRSITFRLPQLLLAGIAAPVVAASAQQSNLAISPFVSFLPSTGASPLAGLALTLGGNSGLAFRASGNFALQNLNASAAYSTDTRPWGADADAMFMFGSRDGSSRSITPFVFTGVGIEGVQNVVNTTTRNDWSYGFGANLPITRAVELFGEARWRMTEYVLPTAQDAPPRTNELRVGLSFQVGGNDPGQQRGRRR